MANGDTRGEVTRLIEAMGRGESGNGEELLNLVYGELRAIAAAQMARERAGHTLQPTALVHEAYLRLMGAPASSADTQASSTHPAGAFPLFENRAHFFAAAAEAMRRILVDESRRRQSLKRGGDLARTGLSTAIEGPAVNPDSPDILALHEALLRMEREDTRMATIVKLRFFGEMSVDEVAAALELSRSTVLRDWISAKAWLLDALGGRREPPP